MTLRQLLEAYEGVYCRIITPTTAYFVESGMHKRKIINAYGDWIVDSFCTYAYDDFDGFIRIMIKEDEHK